MPDHPSGSATPDVRHLLRSAVPADPNTRAALQAVGKAIADLAVRRAEKQAERAEHERVAATRVEALCQE
jgi:hypothetical protein